MAEYWFKQNSGGAVQGPCTGHQLKALAAKGLIYRNSLISADQTKWVKADWVKGLFPDPAVAAKQPPAPAAPQARVQSAASQPPEPAAEPPEYDEHAPAESYEHETAEQAAEPDQAEGEWPAPADPFAQEQGEYDDAVPEAPDAIPAPAPAPSPPLPGRAAAAPPMKSAPVAVASVPYASAPVARGAAGRIRSLQWFPICAAIVCALGLLYVTLVVYTASTAVSSMSPPPKPAPPIVVRNSNGAVYTYHFTASSALRAPRVNPGVVFATLVLLVLFGGGSIALFVYWLIWVYSVHSEMRSFTAGGYEISPGKALGFCFIPFFNIYWIIYMPWKLARTVQLHLDGGTGRINPRAVLTFQVLSLVPGAFMMGALFFDALSAAHIQRGLNALWSQASPTAA